MSKRNKRKGKNPMKCKSCSRLSHTQINPMHGICYTCIKKGVKS